MPTEPWPNSSANAGDVRGRTVELISLDQSPRAEFQNFVAGQSSSWSTILSKANLKAQ